MYKYLIFYFLTYTSDGRIPANGYVVQQNIFLGNLTNIADSGIPSSVKFIEINGHGLSQKHGNSIKTKPNKNSMESNSEEDSDMPRIGKEKDNGDAKANKIPTGKIEEEAVNKHNKTLFEILVEEAGLIDQNGSKKQLIKHGNMTIDRSKLYKIAEILNKGDDEEPTFIFKTNNSHKVKDKHLDLRL